MDLDEEYYCPNCGAILNDQDGFDPNEGIWTCTECGQTLMGDDIYDGDSFEGVAWYCDSCGALLNRQKDFSDSYGSWTCTKCGCLNSISEDDIIEENYKCPNCGANLKKQYDYSKWDDDFQCEECGAHLHREYSSDPYSVIKYFCPSCEAPLDIQSGFSDLSYDYTCSECGKHLQRTFSFEPFEEVTDEDDVCDVDYDSETVENAEETISNEEIYSNHSFTGKDSNTKKNSDYYRPQKKKLSFFEEIARDIKIMIKLAFALLIIYLVSSIALKLNTKNHEINNEIQVSISSDELEDMNYKDAKKVLSNAGFTDIELTPLEDVVVGLLKKEDAVSSVSINGDEDFNKSEWFPSDSVVIIKYHSKYNIFD